MAHARLPRFSGPRIESFDGSGASTARFLFAFLSPFHAVYLLITLPLNNLEPLLLLRQRDEELAPDARPYGPASRPGACQ